MKTQASTKSRYKVYVQTDGSCYLEVFRENRMFYFINNKGQVELSERNKAFISDEKEEIYYLDYLDAKVLEKIDILTQNYNYEEIANKIESLIQSISNGMTYLEFDMGHAYILIDILEALKQMKEFTQESDYAKIAQESNVFFENYFYNRSTHYSEEDVLLIISTLKELKNLIKSFNSH